MKIIVAVLVAIVVISLAVVLTIKVIIPANNYKKASEDIKQRAKNGKFDERLALLGMILDAITAELRTVCDKEKAQTELLGALKNVRVGLVAPKADAVVLVEKQIKSKQDAISVGKKASSLSIDDQKAFYGTIAALEEEIAILKNESPADNDAAFKLLKTDFDNRTKELKKLAEKAGEKLSNVFKFCEEVFAEGQEILILVTELTISYYGAHFISRYGCKEYFNHNKELLFYERQKEIILELENLNLED